MKTAIKSIIVILIEIAVIAALIWGCVELVFPDADEVTITQEELQAGEESNVGGNAGAALEAEVDLEEEPAAEEEEIPGEAEEASEEVPAE